MGAMRVALLSAAMGLAGCTFAFSLDDSPLCNVDDDCGNGAVCGPDHRCTSEQVDMDANGLPRVTLGEQVVTLGAGFLSDPRIATTSSGFAVAWIESPGGPETIHLGIFDPTGGVTDVITVEENQTVLGQHDVAWVPGTYVVAWGHNSGNREIYTEDINDTTLDTIIEGPERKSGVGSGLTGLALSSRASDVVLAYTDGNTDARWRSVSPGLSGLGSRINLDRSDNSQPTLAWLGGTDSVLALVHGALGLEGIDVRRIDDTGASPGLVPVLGTPATTPRVARIDSGVAVVTWLNLAGETTCLMANCSLGLAPLNTANATLEPASPLVADLGFFRDHAIASDGTNIGTVLIDGDGQVLFALLGIDAQLVAQVEVLDSGGEPANPQIAWYAGAGETGHFVAVWEDSGAIQMRTASP
jgi:hypothetical protein